MDKCKRCDKTLAEGEGRKVGAWLFCPACLESLLSEASTAQTSPKDKDAAAGREAGPLKPANPQPVCHLCGANVRRDNHKKLGDWAICENCYAELIPAAPIERADSPPASEPEAESVPAEVTIYPGTLSEKRCNGCEKPLVEGGYYSVDESYFCPDCYYNFLQLQEQEKTADTVPPIPTAAEAKPAAAQAAKPCESCLREIPEQSVQWIEGFRICAACISTDLTTALAIARTRHKKLMELRLEEL